MSVVDVKDAVIVVVVVKVIRYAIRIQVARPCELVNAAVVVIVFVVAAGPSTVAVFVRDTVVVVIHGVLVGQIEIADRPDVVVRMDDVWIEVAVGGDVARIQPLSLECFVIDGPF